MENNSSSHITPIFITIIGSTSVGKSCFLFSLGLTISKYPTVDNSWCVDSIDPNYKQQIDLWKKQYDASGILGATDLGENIQLSFVVKNTRTQRKYEIIIADMAGEEIVRYFNNEAAYARIANDIKMRICLSSGILLMLEADKLDEQKEINAWEQLLTTGMFSSLDICIMKADILPEVRKILEPVHEKVMFETDLSHRLLYDSSSQTSAQKIFLTPKRSKLHNYMKNHDITSRYHYISSLGIYHNQKILSKLDEFINYNIFGALLDILNGIERNFSGGLRSFFVTPWKNFQWKSTLRKATKIYEEKRYREAVEVLFNKNLVRDTRKYRSVLYSFNHILKEIHRKWIQDRKDYEDLSPEVNSENLAQKIQYCYKEVIDRRELEIEIKKYQQSLGSYIKKLLPKDNDLDYTSYVQFLHSQWKTLIGETSEHKSQVMQSILTEIQELFAQILCEQVRWQQQQAMQKSVNIDSLKNKTRCVSLYIATWYTGEHHWRKLLSENYGELPRVKEQILHILENVVTCSCRCFCYSDGLRISEKLQEISASMGSYIDIPDKVFSKKYNEIAKQRLIFFKSIPPLRKMRKEMYFDDNIFQRLHSEWCFWQQQDKMLPPKSLRKKFPQRLLICPVCEGKEHATLLCECINSFWLLRFFHISAEPCDSCRGTGEIAVLCNHCQGKKKRSFV